LKKSSRSRASKVAQHPSSAIAMKPLAVLIAMYCSGAMADPAPDAANTTDTAANDQLAEIVVTGLRQSLVTNESIKRDSNGIVDPKTSANSPTRTSPNPSNGFPG
jgi:hypothetical protein